MFLQFFSLFMLQKTPGSCVELFSSSVFLTRSVLQANLSFKMPLDYPQEYATKTLELFGYIIILVNKIFTFQ